MWGYFLYQGVVDPLGGINTLWPLFGIANQMLAAIALILASVCLVKMKREQFVWIPLAPAAWLVVCTLTAGWEKVFGADPKIGFLSHAHQFGSALDAGKVLAPAKTLEDMHRVIVNDYVDATLCMLFMLVVVATVAFGVRAWLRARGSRVPTSLETPRVPLAGAH
jgi:carbon starvation protein